MMEVTAKILKEGCPRSFAPAVLLRKIEAAGTKLNGETPELRFRGIL
jgi:hypothetical protein